MEKLERLLDKLESAALDVGAVVEIGDLESANELSRSIADVRREIIDLLEKVQMDVDRCQYCPRCGHPRPRHKGWCPENSAE